MEFLIKKYESSDFDLFVALFGEYFNELDVKLTNDELLGVCKDIAESAEKGIVFLDICDKGFMIYQVDSADSDWCEKEGLGFVREIYVLPEARRDGLASQLLQRAENTLKPIVKVPQLYVTCDSEKGQKFWKNQGFVPTGEICEKNNSPVFIKNLEV